MADKDNKGVIPSGSMSVNDDLPDNDEDRDTSASETSDKETRQSKETSKEKDQSKDDSSRYDELKKVFDRQGNELGELRKQNQELYSALLDIQKTQSKTTDSKDGKKQSANDDLSKVLEEYGSLDFLDDDAAPKKGAELMKKAISLTAQMVKEDTLAEADGKMRSMLQEKDVDAVTNQFLDENPDFTDLQSQGVFQALKSRNPLHDDFSAYHAYKAEQAMAQAQELEQALAEAKKVANLAGGDEATSKVFTKPSSEIRARQRPKPRSVSELKQSAMDAVLKAAGAA